MLAIIPPILGFEPGSSLVVLGTKTPRNLVWVTLRYDLPDSADPELAAALAGQVLAVLGEEHGSGLAAVGYGSDEAVAPLAVALRERAAEAGIAVLDVLRVQHGRYWSYVCTDSECCPAAGTPFDVAGHPAARALRAAGAEVLASRDDLAASFAAADGEAGEAMQRATRDAERRLASCAARLRAAGVRVRPGRLVAAIGLILVRDAIERYRAGESVGTDSAAWITLALRELRVRDDAWARMDGADYLAAHQRLWADLTRLARPGYVAAPAALLAFTAWQAGNGAVGRIALDRALADRPGYSMALLLRQALDLAIPPQLARLPMTPEEVAASYDAQEAEQDAPDRASVGPGEAREE